MKRRCKDLGIDPEVLQLKDRPRIRDNGR